MARIRLVLPWFGATLSAPVALFCLAVYIREIFTSGLGDDRSLLFWYLPFLFAGLIAAGAFIRAVRAIVAARGAGAAGRMAEGEAR